MKKIVVLFFCLSLVGCEAATSPKQIQKTDEVSEVSQDEDFAEKKLIASFGTEKIIDEIGPSFTSRREKLLKEELIKRNPNWSQDVKEKVRRGDIVPGMKERQILASRGRPYEVTSIADSDDSDKRWTYATYGFQLYFKNAILIRSTKLDEGNVNEEN
ncbi:hypothetical protein ACFL2J_04800 [Candidatus Omnitrophota bacterium]